MDYRDMTISQLEQALSKIHLELASRYTGAGGQAATTITDPRYSEGAYSGTNFPSVRITFGDKAEVGHGGPPLAPSGGSGGSAVRGGK